MVRVVPASQVKNNFGEVIRRVYENEETQIIEKSGLPVAAIISMSDLERVYPERVKDFPQVAVSVKRQEAAKRLRALLTEMQKGNEKYSEEEVEADVQRAVDEVRHGKKKR